MPTLSRWRTGHAQPADIQKQNERSVLIDGLGVGIVTGVSTFLSVFLTRLGASPFLVGLLTALPALTGMLLAIPAGRFLERQRNMAPWYSWPRAMVQGSFVVMGLIPFFVSQQITVYAVIIIWALVTIPQTIVNITFTVVMGAVAGPRRRLHLQETFSDVVKTDKTGLSKTAHTRWMISAFANFLPGSTIFRLA